MSINGNQFMSAQTNPARVRAWLDAEIPCQEGHGDLWFSDSLDGLALAQRMCQGCLLRVDCLAGAVQRREPWGVWGGELFEQGVPVARKRRPGRPRKQDAAEREDAEQDLVRRLGRSLDPERGALITDRDHSGTAA